MSGLVFLLQLQDLRNCNCQTEEEHNLNQCEALVRGNLSTVDTTTIAKGSTWGAINDGNYSFPLSSHEQVFAFNQRLRRVPLQMELHLRALTELHSAAPNTSTAFDITFQCMFKRETLMLYNWFGTNKLRSFRNFGGITDLLLQSVQKLEPLFNMLRLQKLFNQHVMGLQRKYRKTAKIGTPFKEDVNNLDTYEEIRYICEEMYPIVVTSSEDE